MTIAQAEQLLIEKLSGLYDRAEATAITHLVMEHLTGLNKSNRRMQGQEPLTAAQQSKLEQMKADLLLHKPVQYVTCTAWFYNMELLVNETVLIPRPETEELVQWILEEQPKQSSPSIIDIGTGSGCIPIALKKNREAATVSALDVSEAALQVAQTNAAAQQTAIHFIHASILDESQWPQQQFDIIVSNPPYIPQQEANMLEKNVTDWEPHLALFVADNDPLLFYRTIARFAQQHLAPGGSLYFECHQQFAGAVASMLTQMGFKATLKTDMFDNERMVKAVPTTPASTYREKSLASIRLLTGCGMEAVPHSLD